MRSHDIVCVHTMVGYLTSTYNMFHQNGYGGTESHFGVGGQWGPDGRLDLDGIVWQFQDLDFTADANLNGNHHVISIETADNAPRQAADIEPWTEEQVKSLIKLIASLCKQYDIPAVLIPDTRPGRRGLAFHAMGIPPNLVPGGELWSAVRGKECPGPVRIKQFKEVIVPGVQKALATKIKAELQPVEEENVKLSKALAVALNKLDKDQHKEGDEVSVGHILTILLQEAGKK